jgi:hypothetical protein
MDRVKAPVVEVGLMSTMGLEGPISKLVTTKMGVWIEEKEVQEIEASLISLIRY